MTEIKKVIISVIVVFLCFAGGMAFLMLTAKHEPVSISQYNISQELKHETGYIYWDGEGLKKINSYYELNTFIGKDGKIFYYNRISVINPDSLCIFKLQEQEKANKVKESLISFDNCK